MNEQTQIIVPKCRAAIIGLRITVLMTNKLMETADYTSSGTCTILSRGVHRRKSVQTPPGSRYLKYERDIDFLSFLLTPSKVERFEEIKIESDRVIESRKNFYCV